MNKLIDNLAEQAAQEVRVEHSNPYWRMQDEIKEDSAWREKFADLVIQETLRECYQHLTNTGQDHAREVLEKYFASK